MKRAFFFSALTALLVFASQASALYNIADGFAAEVLLSKPDIVHNLDFMKYAENVSIQENRVTYRCNFDDRVAAILESVNNFEGPVGLSVRLQMPLKEDVTPYVHSVAKFRGVKIDDIGENFLESLGYEVNVVGMGVIDGPWEEPVLERPVDPMPVDTKPNIAVAEEVAPTPFDDEVVVIADNDNPDEKPSIDIRPSSTQSILLNKGNIAWSIIQYEDVDGNVIDFILNIANAETISDEVRKDYQQMLDFYGIEMGERDQLGDSMVVMRAMDLVPDMDLGGDGFDFQSAMKAELEWLRENGIILGITDQDIADISSIAKQGFAGWNSRTAYSEGKWLPYFETDDPYIIRIFEDAIIDEAVDVPKEMIIFPTASVSPGGKSITQWGRVKSGL